MAKLTKFQAGIILIGFFLSIISFIWLIFLPTIGAGEWRCIDTATYQSGDMSFDVKCDMLHAENLTIEQANEYVKFCSQHSIQPISSYRHDKNIINKSYCNLEGYVRKPK